MLFSVSLIVPVYMNCNMMPNTGIQSSDSVSSLTSWTNNEKKYRTHCKVLLFFKLDFIRVHYTLLISTSKNPCYAQATWDWICLKKQKQNKTNKQTNKKFRIKGPT